MCSLLMRSWCGSASGAQLSQDAASSWLLDEALYVVQGEVEALEDQSSYSSCPSFRQWLLDEAFVCGVR